MKFIKHRRSEQRGSTKRKSAEAFKRFVDFMYAHPQLMQEFPNTIVFRDESVELAFEGDERMDVLC